MVQSRWVRLGIAFDSMPCIECNVLSIGTLLNTIYSRIFNAVHNVQNISHEQLLFSGMLQETTLHNNCGLTSHNQHIFQKRFNRGLWKFRPSGVLYCAPIRNYTSLENFCLHRKCGSQDFIPWPASLLSSTITTRPPCQWDTKAYCCRK